MANNMQVVIELLLKNKAAVQSVLDQLAEKHGINIDTTEMDAAFGEIEERMDSVSGAEVVIDGDGSGAEEAAESAEEAVEGVPPGTEVVIDGDGSGAEEAAEGAEEAIKKVPKEHDTNLKARDNVTSVVTAISAGYMALMQAINKAKAAISGLLEVSNVQEKAEKHLQVALKQTGDQTGENFEKFKDLAAKLQELTTIGDEVAMPVMRLGLNMGVLTSGLEEATKGAIGLSKGFNLDLTTAMKMHVLATQNDFTMIQRYIPALRVAKDDAEKMAIVKKAEADGWAVATAETETAFGVLEDYGNTVGDVREKIGDLIKLAIQPFVSELNNVFSGVDSMLAKMADTRAINEERTAFEENAAVLEVLWEKTNKTATEKEVLNEAIEDLQGSYPDYLANISTETTSYESLKMAIEQARISLEERITVQMKEAEQSKLLRKKVALRIKEKDLIKRASIEQGNVTRRLEETGLAQKDKSKLTQEEYITYGNIIRNLELMNGQLDNNIAKQAKITEEVAVIEEQYGALFETVDKVSEKINKGTAALQTKEVEEQFKAYTKLSNILGVIAPQMKDFAPPTFEGVKQSVSEMMTVFGEHTKQLEDLRQAGVDTTSLLTKEWEIFTGNVKQYYGEDSAEYMAVINMKKDADSEFFEWKKQHWIESHQFEMGMIDSIEAGYDTLIGTITDKEMTGKERREAVWESTKNAFVKMLGETLKQYIINLVMQATISKGAAVANIATAVGTGSTIAAAYAPGAALASLATLGGNSIPAMTGISSTVALAQLLAIPKFAAGGVVDRETIATIGEAGPEAIVPLSGGRSIPVEMRGGGSRGSVGSNAVLKDILNVLTDIKNSTEGGKITLVIEDKSNLVGLWRYMLKAEAAYSRAGLN